jgi:antitoxin component YwqK of YwqJK toxin-antitoxin module
MKNIVIILLLVLSSHAGWTQKIQEITHREINIHFNDSSIKANVLLADKKQHLKNSTDYYWYYNNSIKHNQGDYKGRLLDGEYQVTSKKGDLITKGKFSKGFRSGEWKKWNNQGELIDINNWSKGNKKGKYLKYHKGKIIEKGSYQKNKLNGYYFIYENGQLIEKKKYKKGVLHGKQIIYKADTVFSEVLYKKGIEVFLEEKSVKKKAEDNEQTKELKGKKWWQIWRKKEDSSIPIEQKKNKNRKEEENKEKKQKKIKTKKRKEKEGKQESKKDD